MIFHIHIREARGRRRGTNIVAMVVVVVVWWWGKSWCRGGEGEHGASPQRLPPRSVSMLFNSAVSLYVFWFSSVFLHGTRRFGWMHLRSWEVYVPKRLELALLLYNTRVILHIHFVENVQSALL